MRRTVKDLSKSEILEIAEEWGIDVTETEASDIRDRVNDRLDGVDDIYEIPVDVHGTSGDRSWVVPSSDEDPYNALVVLCEVPPTGDGELTGVSIGLKDNILLAGVPTQCGSAVMEGYVPMEDATVVRRLREAGGTISAKTNLDEFAGGGRGLAVDGYISHPLDTDRIPGGSSGGSAAAVLAGQVDVALGTDTGGSVRAPAALCGLVGLKPTYGLVPLTGVIENTYSLDHVGIISESVPQAAACLDAIAGKDERDPASMAAAGRDAYNASGFLDAVSDPKPIAELTLVRLTDAFEASSEPVTEIADRALDDVIDQGGTVADATLPGFDLVDELKDCITCPELAQFWRDGGVPLRRAGGGEWLDQVGFARRADAGSGELNRFYRGRILTGASLLATYDGRHYTRALAARRTLRAAVVEVLENAGADALVCPTVPGVAPRKADAHDPGFGITTNTRLANITEQPGLTIPCGQADDLPVGLHLLGPRFSDAHLLRVGAGLDGKS